jgi:hypothetical protein
VIQYDESANQWCHAPAAWLERQYRDPAPHERRQVSRLSRLCRAAQDAVNRLQWLAIQTAILLGADRVNQYPDGQRSSLKWRPKFSQEVKDEDRERP